MQLLLIFNLIKKIKILLLFGLVANYLLAQNIIDLNFKNIEPEAIGVKAIYRGLYSKKHNFMWLSTNEGLGIYNGYYYRKMINPNDSNDKPLSKRILTLYEDKDGFLWIGYQDSIGFTGFDYETKHFTHFKPDKSNKDVFAKEFIPSQFYQDLENRIWIATWGGGLLQYNKITKKFKCYNTETKFTNNAKIVCATVRTIFELEKNKFLICFFQEQPAAYPSILDLDKNTLTEFPIENYAKNLSPLGLAQLKRFSTIIHKTFYDQQDQKIWFGGYSCVFYIDLKNKQSKRVSPRTFKQEDDINLDNVSDFIKCRDGNIWASTTNSGIMIINPVTLRAKYHKQDGNCATCVGDNAIRNFTCDKNDNIWVFNVSNKISVNTPFAQEIKVKKWSELNLDYLNASHQAVPVSQMLAHSTHKIYLGSSKGLSVYDYQNDSLLKTITFGKTSYENSIQTFKFGKNNTVEFARNNTNKNYSHFAIHNLNTGKTTNEKTLQHIYSVNFLNDSVSGTYAFSKYYTDLFKYNYFKNTFDTFFVFPPEKAPEPSYGLKINDNKFLFYTDKKGFTLLDSKLKKVTTFKPNKGDKFFPDSILTSYYFNNKSSLWIGTNNGLYEFNTNTETFVDHSIYLNIKNNIIYNVFEDPSGVVWFTTSNDLFRYEPRKKTVYGI
jgi:ligand-binding sensor domain-containing protein